MQLRGFNCISSQEWDWRESERTSIYVPNNTTDEQNFHVYENRRDISSVCDGCSDYLYTVYFDAGEYHSGAEWRLAIDSFKNPYCESDRVLFRGPLLCNELKKMAKLCQRDGIALTEWQKKGYTIEEIFNPIEARKRFASESKEVNQIFQSGDSTKWALLRFLNSRVKFRREYRVYLSDQQLRIEFFTGREITLGNVDSFSLQDESYKRKLLDILRLGDELLMLYTRTDQQLALALKRPKPSGFELVDTATIDDALVETYVAAGDQSGAQFHLYEDKTQPDLIKRACYAFIDAEEYGKSPSWKAAIDNGDLYYYTLGVSLLHIASAVFQQNPGRFQGFTVQEIFCPAVVMKTFFDEDPFDRSEENLPKIRKLISGWIKNNLNYSMGKHKADYWANKAVDQLRIVTGRPRRACDEIASDEASYLDFPNIDHDGAIDDLKLNQALITKLALPIIETANELVSYYQKKRRECNLSPISIKSSEKNISVQGFSLFSVPTQLMQASTQKENEMPLGNHL